MAQKAKAVLMVVAAAAILLGLLWMGQGLNLIKGSSMTGDPKWLVIGAICFLAGILIIIGGIDRRHRGR